MFLPISHTSSAKRISVVHACLLTGAGGVGSQVGHAHDRLCPRARDVVWSDLCPGLRTEMVSGEKEWVRNRGSGRSGGHSNTTKSWLEVSPTLPSRISASLLWGHTQTPVRRLLWLPQLLLSHGAGMQKSAGFSWKVRRHTVQAACSGQTGQYKLCLGARGTITEQLSPAGQVQTGLHPLSPGLAGLLSPPTSSLEGPAKRGP